MDTNTNIEQKNPPLDYDDEIYGIVVELVKELNWRYNDEHKALVIRALRLVGLSDIDIKGYFAGNIIL